MCPPQKRRKHNQHLKLLFSKENLRFGTSEQISVCRKLNLLAIITQGIVQNQDLRLGNWDPETWDPGPQDLETQAPETLRPGTLAAGNLRLWDPGIPDPDSQDPWTGTLGHGTLTPRTLEIGPWELEIATLRTRILRAGPWELNLWRRFQVSWPAPQIELILIVKQILIIKS